MIQNKKMPVCARLAIQSGENVADLVVAARDLVEPVSLDSDYVEPFVAKVEADSERFEQAALAQYGSDSFNPSGLTEAGTERCLDRTNTRYGFRLTRLTSALRAVSEAEETLDLDPEVRKSLGGLVLGYEMYRKTQAMDRGMF